MPSMDQMLAQMEDAYKSAETQTQYWFPPDGTYSAVVSGFSKEARKLRNTGKDYVAFFLSFQITDGEYGDRETTQVYNNLPTEVSRQGTSKKETVYFKLSAMKSAAQVLNDGTIEDSLSNSLDLLEAHANSRTPVQIRVSSRQYEDKKKVTRTATDITIVEVGS